MVKGQLCNLRPPSSVAQVSKALQCLEHWAALAAGLKGLPTTEVAVVAF